ncbi:MAG: glutamate--cysteine ligase [marine bacterium B5-7]|nr:MAG: glutamate--cysteine ligase [marine bacterium B5-7]
MTDQLETAINNLERSGAAETLGGIRRGLEKESLRVGLDGVIAATPHPHALGSALSHSSITTDYSEALLEFITPVHDDIDSMLEFLADLHIFTYHNLGDEILWTNSMPCILQGDSSIPIADFGTSNTGFMKHVYRRGLGNRYGRLMQTIAGIHYNFSLPDHFFNSSDNNGGSASVRYFDLLRNFHRHCWLVLYLFGSAPAVCRSFVKGRDHTLTPFGKNSLYLPHGTTLRMSRLGYQNSAQSDIHVCTNSVEDYVRTLRAATEQNYPPYERIGVVVDDEYQQLNTNILQIENEFYSVIRPKRTINPMEKPTTALASRGVEYIEVRIMDLNPFTPIGIDADTIRFLDAFLVYCLLEPSPPINHDEEIEIAHNRDMTVTQGRADETRLFLRGAERPFREEALRVLDGIEQVADLMDRHAGGGHADVVHRERDKINQPDSTPSARIIEEMSSHNEAYFEYAMRTAGNHQEYFLEKKLSPDTEQKLVHEAEASRAQTRALEEAQLEPFKDFLARYFAG